MLFHGKNDELDIEIIEFNINNKKLIIKTADLQK